jgi:hypothetical protein
MSYAWLPPAPELEPSRSRRRGVRVFGVVAVAAVVAGAAAFALVRWGDGGHPARWDPRVAELAAFVARERKLDFEHPVDVQFVEPKVFEEELSADASGLSGEERNEMEEYEAMYRAVGLIDADVDLLDSFSDIQSSDTLAYYSFDDQTVRVRGTELTPAVRITLVHELTHVLQDQHFDIGRIQAAADDEGSRDQQGDVLRGLAEGDADRIGDVYREGLSEEDRDAAEEEESAEIEAFDDEDHPPVLTALFAAPYALGRELVDLVIADAGPSALDELFVDPPRFDLALLDPLSQLAGREGELLDTPELSKGEERVDDGGFGALTLYLMLAQRIDPERALAASSAWGADAYVAYRSGERVCVRATFAGEDAAGKDRIVAALSEWVGDSREAAQVVERGRTVTLNACDAGDAAPQARGLDVEGLFTLPVARAQIGQSVLASGGTAREARCFGDRVVAAFTTEQLQAEELSPADEQQLAAIGASCRGS